VQPILWHGPWGLTLYGFGLMVALGFVLGGALGIARATRLLGCSPSHALEALLWLSAAGLLGAKLTYLVFFPQWQGHAWWWVLLQRGGLVWYGGLLGAMLAWPLVARAYRWPWLALSDAFMPAVLLGLALGRVGCLLAGCCYGAVTQLPWAIHYPDMHPTSGLGVHPAPLYESGGAILILTLLLWAERRYQWSHGSHGRVTGWFLIGYSLLRFGLEAIRGDRLVWLEAVNLSASQVLSLGVGVLGVALLLWLRFEEASA
jgi:phosphatidylglycerol:prolipoprotein diacylglycerol transferase